jgi:hypothetical protein
MNHELLGPIGAIVLAIGVFILIEVGQRMGAKQLVKEGDDYLKGVGAIESAVFALLGLILAFSFSGALTRFDERRQLVITEAENISTAWSRISLLPDDAQAPMRDLFRRYLDARIAAYRRLPDWDAFRTELDRTGRLQDEIWSKAVAGTRTTSSDVPLLLLPSLNNMFDIVTRRTEVFRIHTPFVIFYMLGALSLACALFSGHDMALRRRRSLLHSVSFAVVLAVTFYVIVDLEYPRLGLIHISDSDQVLIDLRKTMDREALPVAPH